MCDEQAGKVPRAASGQAMGYVRVVKVSAGNYAAIRVATNTSELARGTWARLKAPVNEISTDLGETTCRFCRPELG
jgi:hypothetical protein